MAQFPGLTIWTDAWVADTDHLTCEEEGIYFRLVRVMWRAPGCRVPNDDQWLAKHMRMTLSEVTGKVRPIVTQFCQTDGNWIFQKRLKREFVRRFEFSAAQSVRAKSRWRKKKDICPDDATNGNPPYPTPTAIKKASFPTAATEKKKPNGSARSLASALPEGALTREPDTENAGPEEVVAEKKRPEELSLAEINAIRYGAKR
jgi:uncharacterized protein YdaU (DUF1376 family)